LAIHAQALLGSHYDARPLAQIIPAIEELSMQMLL
jgi:hypothetical protein